MALDKTDGVFEDLQNFNQSGLLEVIKNTRRMKGLVYRIIKYLSPENTMTNTSNVNPPESIYNIPVVDIQGRTSSLEAFRGKKMLIVNTASECGYTPQYESLQELHKNYGDRVAVLAFPSNDFGAQEPGDEMTIKAFCQSNYGVTFPLFGKIHTIGEKQHPLYQWLSNPQKNGWNSQAPTWNFCKYLVDEHGKLLNFFNAATDPLDKLIIG